MLTLDSPAFQELRRDFNEWLPAIADGRDKFVPAHTTHAEEPPKHWYPEVSRIVAAVARKAGCKPSDLLTPNRQHLYARPRMVAYLLAVETCPHLSYTVIARAFAGRDRTTIASGLVTARRLIAENEDWREFHDAVSREIR